MDRRASIIFFRTLDCLKQTAEPAGGLLTTDLRKYSCRLAIDTNTVSRYLRLSDNNRKVIREGLQPYPDHPDRFDLDPQLLCETALTARSYWEVEWSGRVYISVSYRRIGRKGGGSDRWFGWNHHSWSLSCSDGGYSVRHENIETPIVSSSVSPRAAVYVDCPAGILSFYRIAADEPIHLHTFRNELTEALYPGFAVWSGSSVSLC